MKHQIAQRTNHLRMLCSILTVGMFVLAGCTALDSASRGQQVTHVILTQADNGKAIEVAQGENVQIDLSENPTTGYRWAIDGKDQRLLNLVSDDYASSSTMPGAGGIRTLVFKATDKGTMQLQLKLWRDWEGDSSIIQRFSTTITVR